MHVLGTSIEKDVCLLEEKDSKFYFHVGTTKNREFIVLTAASKMASEVHLLHGSLPEPFEPILVQSRIPGLEYFVECCNEQLVVLANHTKSGNYALYTTTLSNPQKEHWKQIVSDNEAFVIEDLEVNRERCLERVPLVLWILF